MLLTLMNLPNDIKFSEIKELVRSKCGIEEIILDNMIPHEKRTKKVTIGLAGEVDAAIFMRKINGMFFRGNTLQVVQKTKAQSSHVSNQAYGGPHNQMQSVGQPPFDWQSTQNVDTPRNYNFQDVNSSPQGHNFGPGSQNYRHPSQNLGFGQNINRTGQNFGPRSQNYDAPGRNSGPSGQQFGVHGQSFRSQGQNFGLQNVPNIVPGTTCVADTSSMNPNQSAYYMINQPAYRPTLSTSSMDSNTFGYGNVINQSRQSTWSGNNREQREQNSLGFESIEQSKDRSSQRSRDRSPIWNRRGESELDNRRDSNRDNRGSDRDNRSSNRDNRGSDRDIHGANRDIRGSNRDSRGSNRDNRGANRDNRGSNQDNREISRDDNRRSRRNKADWNEDRDSNRNQDRVPVWEDNCESNANKDMYQRGDKNRESRWETNPDNSRDRDALYSRREQNNFRLASHQMNKDRGNDLFDRRPVHGQPKREQNRSAPNKADQWRDPNQVSSSRPRLPQPARKGTSMTLRSAVPVSNKGKPMPNKQIPKQQSALALTAVGKKWRMEIASTQALKMLSSNRCAYTGVNSEQLHEEFKKAILDRVNDTFQNDYTSMPIKNWEQIYRAKYPSPSHWALLRDVIEKMGGELLTNVNEVRIRKRPKKQKAPVISGSFGSCFGNIKVDRRFEPQTSAPQPQPEGINKQQTNTPLALIPGRIPHYPQGVKELYKQQKKQDKEFHTNEDHLSNLMNSLKPGIKKALEEEAAIIAQLVSEECHDPTNNPKITDFCEKLKKRMPRELEKALKSNITKRIIPLHPIQVRVYTSKHVKRQMLEEVLAEDITCLRKSVRDIYYIAGCETVEQHDKLCLNSPFYIGEHMVRIKPFHMVGLKEKKPRVNIKGKIKKLVKAEAKNSANALELEENTETPDSDEAKPETAINETNKEETESGEAIKKETPKQDTEIEESIEDTQKQEIDFTKDINLDNFDTKPTDTIDTKEEKDNVSPKTETYESLIKSTDFTEGSKIDEAMDNLNESDCLPVIEDKLGDGMVDMCEVNEGESEAPANVVSGNDDNIIDNIDWADVNDEDLEDW